MRPTPGRGPRRFRHGAGRRPCRGRRPSMSSQRSGGVRSITLVKLTTSLAAVSPAIPASRTILAGGAGLPLPPRRACRRGRWRRRRRASPAPPGPRGASPARHPGAATAAQARPRAGRVTRQRAAHPRPAPLDRPARAQVEQVEQVGAASRQARVDHDVRSRAAEQRSAGQSRSADAGQLHRTAGHLAPGERAQVPAEAAAVPAAGQVVIAAECRRAAPAKPAPPGRVRRAARASPRRRRPQPPRQPGPRRG